MRLALRKPWPSLVAGTLAIMLVNLSLLAQEGSSASADPNMTVETIFRWLNFAVVFGVFAYVIGKFGGPYFRGRSRDIASSIRQATEARAAAERDLQEAIQRLAGLDLEVQDLRRAAVKESAAEAERIRALARTEADKIGRAASAEIEAAERAARQELRAVAARAATDRAAAMVRARLTAASEEALFHSFVVELERSVS